MPSKRNETDNDNKISHYLLESLLVEQATSAIYLAKDEKTNDAVFLVTLQPDAARSSDLAQRFQRRAETLAQLEHEAILPVLDYGLDGKRTFAVMSFIPGQFLAEQLDGSAAPTQDDKSQVVQSLTLVQQIATGLSVAHPTGLIHHNLRPENIYINEAGQPFLLDLVVPPTPPVASQANREPLAELDYQSPEQLTGKALSGRSNIFSLGILLYRLLAGHKPALPVSEWDIFEYKGIAREVPLNQVRPDLTSATYAVVQECLWQKEWSRFETVTHLSKALDKAVEREAAPPPPPPPIWLRFFNWLRQPQTRKFVVPAIGVLLLLILVMMVMRGRANRQQNGTPTPDTAVPAQLDDAVVDGPAATPTTLVEATDTPAASTTIEETDTPSPTNTAVPPTPTSTPSPTPAATELVTTTPSPEPTEETCVPTQPFGWVRYSIQENDSLSSLAQATNITAERLQEVNCLDSILLSIGQTIWLPPLPTPVATEAPATETETAVPPAPGDDPAPTSAPPTSVPPTSGPPTPTAPPAP